MYLKQTFVGKLPKASTIGGFASSQYDRECTLPGVDHNHNGDCITSRQHNLVLLIIRMQL